MKWNVIAVAMCRDTRMQISNPRTELIDTDRNQMFHQCTTPLNVEVTYEAFWNHLNPRSKEIVKVIGVCRA